MERWHGRAQWWRSPVAWVPGARKSLEKLHLKMMVMIMLFYPSLARGWVDLDATGERTSGGEARTARNAGCQACSRFNLDNSVNHVKLTSVWRMKMKSPSV